MHSAELLMTLAGGLGAALLFGYTAHYLRLSPIVGYLLAGIVVSPNTPGFVADGEIASQLAELGVMLLMFGVGLHFDIGELARVRQYALPGAICQCAVSFLLGFLIAWYGGWSIGASCVFGIAASFASTVVVTRVFADRNDLQTHAGNVALGWLIVQDVLAVLALVLLPPLTQDGSPGVVSILWLTLFTIFKLAVVGIAIVWIGGRIVPAVLRRIADTRSRELFTLSVLVLVLGIALGASELFGVSVALGAFLAGVVVGQSDFSLRAATDALPMQDAFAVLFFVSVGMLFDARVFMQSSWFLIGLLVLVLVITPTISLIAMLSLGAPLSLASKVATSLGQIGEFSFIVANVGKQVGVLGEDAMHVLVAVSMITISFAPFFPKLAVPVCERIGRIPAFRWLTMPRIPFSTRQLSSEDLQEEPIEVSHNAIIIGFGPVGKTVARLLQENGLTPRIIEMNHESLSAIREAGYKVILGDANHRETLRHAGIENCSTLILSASTIRGAEEVVRTARELNPTIQVIARSAYIRERSQLLNAGADTVFSGESEVAMALVEHILRDLGATPEQIDRERNRVRSEIFH